MPRSLRFRLVETPHFPGNSYRNRPQHSSLAETALVPFLEVAPPEALAIVIVNRRRDRR